MKQSASSISRQVAAANSESIMDPRDGLFGANITGAKVAEIITHRVTFRSLRMSFAA